MRDENGFLDINHYKNMHKELNGHTISYWLSNGEQEGIYKVVFSVNLYRELLFPTILKNIKVNVVENDLATYHNFYGIFSKSYRDINVETYSFEELIQKYCEEVLKCNYNYKQKFKLYNMSDMLDILKWICKINHIEFPEETTKQELFISFMMQILLADKDSNSKNKEIYFEDTLKFSPFFDLEFCGWANLKVSLNNYRFGFYTDRSTEKPGTYIETIKYFKNYATKEEMDTFMTYLEQLQALKINAQYEEIETQINAQIPEAMKLKLKKDYESNLRNVSALINDKK